MRHSDRDGAAVSVHDLRGTMAIQIKLGVAIAHIRYAAWLLIDASPAPWI
jgi:hypothetical protein